MRKNVDSQLNSHLTERSHLHVAFCELLIDQPASRDSLFLPQTDFLDEAPTKTDFCEKMRLL
jgi:hypothetical protein